MSDKSLSHLRSSLEELTHAVVTLLSQRQVLVEKIAKVKNQNTQYWMFDPKREREFFLSLLSDKQSYQWEFLALLTAIVELQAAVASKAYPRWSQYAHLSKRKNEPWESINPVLLSLYAPKAFKELCLCSEFEYLRQL